MDYKRLVGGVVIIVVGAVLLYYLYDYLFNVGSVQKKAEIVPSPRAATGLDLVYPPAGSEIKLNELIFTGGEMSISFWIYVTGTRANSTYKKHIFHIGTDANGTAGNVVGCMLGPTQTNALYIKVAEGADFNLQSYAAQGPSTSDVTGRCHITNMEFGRWVNVSIVLNNNLCDVYVDGKLSRSCVLDSQFLVPSAVTPPVKIYICRPTLGTNSDTTWSGSLSGFNFFNYALSPDEAYRIYFAGPSGAQGDLWSAIKSFFGAGAKVAANIQVAQA